MNSRKLEKLKLVALLLMGSLACSTNRSGQGTVAFRPYHEVTAAELRDLQSKYGLPHATPTLTMPGPKNDLLVAEKTAQESGIAFGYVNGGCHGRAHALGQLLSRKGVDSFKVWAFPPGKYTLARSELIEVPSTVPGATNEKVTWGYHVATAINTPSGIKVIDPSFSSSALDVAAWLQSFKCSDCYVVFTDRKWYLFNTLNGYKVNEIEIPGTFPAILTGGFWECSDSPCSSMVNELALNDAAVFLMKRLTDQITPMDAENTRQSLRKIQSLEQELSSSSQPSHLVEAKSWYEARRKYWATTLAQ